MFCGRYNIVLSLLTKTDASPFVRDYIQSINILDYIEIDVKNKAIFETMKNKSVTNLITIMFIKFLVLF